MDGRFALNTIFPQAGWHRGVNCSALERDGAVGAGLRLRNGNETGFNNCRRNRGRRFRARCNFDSSTKRKDHEQRSGPEERRKKETRQDAEGKARGKAGQEEGLSLRGNSAAVPRCMDAPRPRSMARRVPQPRTSPQRFSPRRSRALRRARRACRCGRGPDARIPTSG